MQKIQKRAFGNLGEDYAVRLLQKEGYSIVERNYYTRSGEIDIIAKKGDTLSFIEVKTRSTSHYGLPEEAVTTRKLMHLRRAIEVYILFEKPREKKYLIEVIAIQTEGKKVISVKKIKVI